MLRSCKSLTGNAIGATDGEIGRAYDFLFDDHAWTIRYLVVDTSKWLPGRRVLISPSALRAADWNEGVLHVNRTRSEIKNSPPVDSDKPVSRQKEEELSNYFGWPAYWVPAAPGAGAGYGAGVPGPVGPVRSDLAEMTEIHGDPNLQSAREVIGYDVETNDGGMGHIEDFILDDETWTIRYVVVDTVNWWPGKKVILSPDWILGVSWDTRSVRFDMTKQQLKDAPEYDPSQSVNREFEVLLYDYYGRPRYWQERRAEKARY